MSPSRTPSTYKPRRDRREVVLAVLGVAVVLVIAVALIWVFAPQEEAPIDLPEFVPPPASSTTLPGASTSIATTPSTTPG